MYPLKSDYEPTKLIYVLVLKLSSNGISSPIFSITCTILATHFAVELDETQKAEMGTFWA